MVVQFLLFPTAAKRYGVLNCTKVVALAFPFLYLATPFTALVPGPMRNFAVFFLLLGKLVGNIFGFPCLTILLTNSAASLTVLGTLNGVGTSVAAFGRAAGPAIMGEAFSFGIERGFIIIPWWALAAFSGVSAIPVFWCVDVDGLQGDGDEEQEDEEQDCETRHANGDAHSPVASDRNWLAQQHGDNR